MTKLTFLNILSSDVEFKDVTDELICLEFLAKKVEIYYTKITKEDFI